MLMFRTKLPTIQVSPPHARIMLLAALCFANGVLVGASLGWNMRERAPASPEVVKQARDSVENDMRAACASWFTDKRGAEGRAGKVVVCKAPGFLTVQEK